MNPAEESQPRRSDFHRQLETLQELAKGDRLTKEATTALVERMKISAERRDKRLEYERQRKKTKRGRRSEEKTTDPGPSNTTPKTVPTVPGDKESTQEMEDLIDYDEAMTPA
jgi:hypothetical protein